MKLYVLLPERVLLETETVKVRAEAVDGHFCLEPRHVDFIAPLVPGVLSYVTPAGRTAYVAVDEGVLVKCGFEVRVSTFKAVAGDRLEILQAALAQEIRQLNEAEQATRSALARLEAGILRQYGQLKTVLQ